MQQWFSPSPSSDLIFGVLTSNVISTMSQGRIRPMTPIQAAALMGSWIIETGRRTLDQLDVIEVANNQKGRA